MRPRTSITLLCFAALLGCAQKPILQHVVLIDLKDDSASGALVADCDRLLRRIPSVLTYWCGVPATSPAFSRQGVDHQYDVALCVSFDSAAGYKAYLSHPDHLELVTTWKPHMEWIKIYDALTKTPRSDPTTLAKP